MKVGEHIKRFILTTITKAMLKIIIAKIIVMTRKCVNKSQLKLKNEFKLKLHINCISVGILLTVQEVQ